MKKPTHLAVVIGQREQGHRAVGVAAVADRRHVSVPHDRRGGQRLAGGVRMRHGVAQPGRGGQLGAQRQVLLDLLTLGLVEVELGVLQVVLYLQRHKSQSRSVSALRMWEAVFHTAETALSKRKRTWG